MENGHQREERFQFRLAAPLREELKAEAAEQCRTLSGLVRKILIDHAAERMAGREAA